MNPVLAWLKGHWLSIVVGVIICWLSIGINYAVFLKPSIKVSSGGTYVEGSKGLRPTVGCATGREFIGWAHEMAK